MNKSQGFTLVEMVIVIVLLGILAVSAAPKFLNMQGSAYAATLRTLGASIESAGRMTYSKALLLNQAAAENYVIALADGNTVRLDFGYPEAEIADLRQVVEDIDSFQATTGGADAGTTIYLYPPGYTVDGTDANDNCFVGYTSPANSGSEGAVTVDITEC